VRIKGIGGALRGFAAAQVVVSNTIQIDLANQLSQMKSKGFLSSSKAPEALSVAKGRSCKLRILEVFKAQIRQQERDEYYR
jgi:hypothetical protein